ncbi:hypothetical protein F4814DRAFT_422213 [Daldinia grandis]|nr:hypothetical protein F4814DRAFT_422213 [Daldinia grandis]
MGRNHVFVYRELLRSVGINLPDAGSVAFVREGLGMDDVHVWRAAVSQLLISLFPDEFLPEMLGFNLRFEQLTLETPRAARRLPELGVSGYYFALHVCIDNAHSGHAAMALGVVSRYLDMVRLSAGKQAAGETWRRVQSGYVLSKQVGAHCVDSDTVVSPFPLLSEQEARVARIFQQKAQVSQSLHYSSRVKIGGRSLAAWLSPDTFESSYGQAHLLDTLGRTTPWVRSGNSSDSLLIHELSWGGKMFGAFMDKEVEQIKDWIDSLGTSNKVDDEIYWRMVGACRIAESSVEYSVSQDQEIPNTPFRSTGNIFTPRPALQAASSSVCWDSLLPLWFAHACLLQWMVSVPYRTTSPLGCLIVRLLRTEYGFALEPAGVAGIEGHNPYGAGLIDLGLELVQRNQQISNKGLDALQLSLPQCLGDVLSRNPLKEEDAGSRARIFAGKMLQWSRSPVANEATLLGLARAFLDLEVWVMSVRGLLSEETRQNLKGIVKRKTILLESCMGEIKDDAELANNVYRDS